METLDRHELWVESSGLDGEQLWFRNADLRGWDFSGRILRTARFEHCDLRGCNFKGADLDWAKLLYCRLDDCDFTDASMEWIYLTGSSLTGATLNEIDWAEHVMVAELLRRGGCDEEWIRYIEEKAELCWCDFLREIPEDVIVAGLEVLKGHGLTGTVLRMANVPWEVVDRYFPKGSRSGSL